jgi:hypothetical protein
MIARFKLLRDKYDDPIMRQLHQILRYEFISTQQEAVNLAEFSDLVQVNHAIFQTPADRILDSYAIGSLLGEGQF